jgi:hypothetical protein
VHVSMVCMGVSLQAKKLRNVPVERDLWLCHGCLLRGIVGRRKNLRGPSLHACSARQAKGERGGDPLPLQ